MQTTIENRDLSHCLPAEVIIIMDRLHQARQQVYLVGGGLRNLLLNLPVKDWDLATSAKVEQIQALFDDTLPTGLAHGTVTVQHSGKQVEVTTLRLDGPYLDGRRPSEVTFTDNLYLDLARRDFTINALAYDPWGEEGPRLHDPFFGRTDLARQRIRTVGDADQRFSEDGLRLIRAARFAAQLGFSIEARTLVSMRRNARLLARVSRERVHDEWMKLIQSAQPWVGIQALATTNLIPVVFPTLTKGQVQRGTQQLRQLLRIEPAASRLLRLVSFFYPLPASTVQKMLRGLRCSTIEIQQSVALLQAAQKGAAYPREAVALHRLVAMVGVELASSLAILLPALHHNNLASRRWAESLREFLSEERAFDMKQLAIGGEEVMRWGQLEPSPEVGKRLQWLLEKVWESPQYNQRPILSQLMVEKWRNDLWPV